MTFAATSPSSPDVPRIVVILSGEVWAARIGHGRWVWKFSGVTLAIFWPSPWRLTGGLMSGTSPGSTGPGWASVGQLDAFTLTGLREVVRAALDL